LISFPIDKLSLLFNFFKLRRMF